MFSFHLLSNTAAWGNKTHKSLPTEKILVSLLTVQLCDYIWHLCSQGTECLFMVLPSL